MALLNFDISWVVQTVTWLKYYFILKGKKGLKDRQYNGQTNRGKHLYRNLEIEQREPNYKPGMNYDEPEGRTDFAPLVAPVVLLFLFQTQW